MTTQTKLSKAGYPKEVFIIESSDMCRGNYHKGKKGCLIGQVDSVFHPLREYEFNDAEIYGLDRTRANKKAKEKLKELIEKICGNENIDNVEDFNDSYSKKLKLNLDFLSRLFNTMLYEIGYNVPKKYRLNKKELEK